MKRIFTLFFLMALICAKSSGQISGYSFAASPGSYTALSGATTVTPTGTYTFLATKSDEGAYNSLPIGFTFYYGGSAYTTISASTDGFATLGATLATGSFAADYSPNDLTDGTGVSSSGDIAPLWDDLDMSNGTFSYQTSGTAGNYVFTMEWKNAIWNYSILGGTIAMDFQVKLYQATGAIQFIYNRENGTSTSGSPSASIGIGYTNSSLSTGILSLNNSGTSPTASSTETTTISTKPANGQTYTFSPTFPVIGGFTPTAGCANTSSVTITGINLSGTTSVKIGGTPATITSTSANQVTATVGNGTTGTISVATPAGTATSTGTFTVNPAPSITSVTATPSAICSGSTSILTAVVPAIASTSALGSGTSTTNSTSAGAGLGPNPFEDWYGGSKQQILITASELTAMGLGAGSQISALQIQLASANTSYALQNYTVKMQHTSLTGLTGTFTTSGFSTVYGPVTYTPSGGGYNSIPFAANFTWNGTSNLLVETSYSNNNTGSTGTTSAYYGSTSFVSTAFYRADNTTSASIASQSSASYTYSSRNNLKLTFTAPATTTWAPISGLYTNAATTTAYTSGTNASTVYAKLSNTTASNINTVYTATATNAVTGCTATSPATITVRPLPTASISGTQTICSGSSANLSIAFTGTAPWSVSYSDGTNTYTINNINSNPYIKTVSPVVTITYSLTALSVGDANCSGGATSGSATVTVNPVSVGGTVSGSATVCAGSNAGTLSLSGNTGNVVQWESSVNNGTTWTTVSNTTTSLSYSNLTQTTQYRALVKSGVCSSAYSSVATITVSPASVGGVINSSTSVCSGTNSGTLTLSGNTGSITRWESSVNSGTTWTNLANTTTSQSYNNLTQTTQYRALVQSGACSSIYSATATITVSPVSVGGSVSGSAALCSGATGTLSLSGNTGNVVRWESSLNTGTTWTNIANTTASLHYTNLAQTTEYRALVQSGTCSSTYSTIATITIKPTPTANISPVSGSACAGQSVAVDITGTASASVTYSINPGTSQTKTLPIPTINSPSNTGDYTYTINSVSLNGCSGTISNGTATVSIHALPDAAISGYSYVQIGNTINLTGATSGGNWSSDNTTSATVGTSTGIVTGASSGTTTITYNVSTTSGGTTCSGSSTKPVSITADYVTRNNGNFSSIATWKRGTVNGFVNATAIPATVNTIEVQHDLTLDQDFQAGANKSFVMSADGTLLIQPGKVFSSLGIVNFGHKAVTVKSDASGTGAIGQMASLIANADHVTIERYIGSLAFQQGRRAWRLVTSPITDKTIRQTWQEDGTIVSNYGTQITGEGLTSTQASQAGFDYIGAGNHTSIKTYTAATASGSWNILPGNGTSGTNILTSSQPAWMVFVRGDRTVNTATGKGITTLRATGTLNQAVTSVTVDHTKAYTLVGNPYAAPISFDNIYNSSISHTFVIWNSQQGAYGAYNFITKESNGSYTLVPFNATSGTTDNNAKYIQSGAGFFVSPASASTDGNITITESSKNMSAAGGIGTFRESAQTDRKLWVNLNIKNSDTSATVADGVLTRFDDAYSPETDGDDAVKQYNFNENLLIATDSHNLMIEARPDVQKTDTIHLELYGVSKRNYQFQIKADNFSSAPGIAGWLEDNYLNTKEAIDLSGNIITINFAVTSDGGSWKSDRFRIVFENKTLAVLPVTLTNIKATPKDAGVSINWTVSNEVNMKGYTVEKSVDDGRAYTAVATQAAKNGTGAAITTYIAFDSQPIQGENLYRIRTEAKDGTVTYSSVVTVTIATATKGIEIAVYPNPVREGKAHLQLTNLQPGAYLASVYSEGGQVVYQKKITISQAGSVQSEDLYVSKNLAQGSYRLAITDSKGTMVKEMKLIAAK